MRKAVNLILILLGFIGFFFSAFTLIYYNVKGGFLVALFFMILFLEAFILRVERHADEEPHKLKAVLIQTPLSSGFMLTSIMGAIISVFVVIPLSLAWGFTFTLVFIIMFIASMISMTQAPVGDQDLVDAHMEQLGFHYRMHHRRNPFKKK